MKKNHVRFSEGLKLNILSFDNKSSNSALESSPDEGAKNSSDYFFF